MLMTAIGSKSPGSTVLSARVTLGVLSLVALFTLNPSGQSHAATIEVFPGTNVFGAAAEGLKAGDTLIVHQGTYLETNRMSLQVQGTPSAPILIKGADGEARPLIARPSSASVQNTINIEGSARYLTIKGLEITSNGGDGINMSGALSFITLDDLVIHEIDVGVNFRSSMDHITVRRAHIYNTGSGGGTGEGMYVGCNDATCIVHDSIIENNWIHDVLPGTSQGDGIEVKYGSHSNVVRDNVIYNRPYPGILVYGTLANPVNIIEGNVVWNSSEGISALADAIVRNNIVISSGCGLCIYNHVQVTQRKNVTAVNNTLYGNDSGVYYRWSGSNLVLANNAVYSPGATAVDGTISATGAVVANFVEGGMSGESIGSGRFSNGGSSTAVFGAPASNNFWPKVGSPLLGAANATYVPPADFNWTTRDSPYDVGAYEVNGLASNPGWQITAGFKATPGQSLPPTAPTNLRLE